MRITAKYTGETDSVTLEFRSISHPGTSDVSIMLAFWQQCINQDWLEDVGRKVQITVRDTVFSIEILPNFQVLPLPIHETMVAVTLHGLRNLLSAIEARNSCQGQLIVIKWHSINPYGQATFPKN